jgi:hypothetical protein
MLVRYADDLIALCHSRDQAEHIKQELGGWLALRGLTFNEDKTSIVHLDEGLDFLGFNVRRYSGKLLIKPSKAAIRRIRQKLRAEMRSLRGSNAAGVLQKVGCDPHVGTRGLAHRAVRRIQCASRSANPGGLGIRWPGKSVALGRKPPYRGSNTTMIEDDGEGTTVSLRQTRKPQRHAPRGGMGVPGYGRPISLANTESSYPGRWRR